MGYVITGTTKKGKTVKVRRKTKLEADRHARAARAFGGKNIKIRRG